MNPKNHKPGRSIGIFLIILGLFIAAVMFDVLQLGNPERYFVWPIILLFIGVIAFFNKNLVGGLIMISIGGYFLLPKLDIYIPHILDNFYWPAAVVLVGIAFIISGVIRKSGHCNRRDESNPPAGGSSG